MAPISGQPRSSAETVSDGEIDISERDVVTSDTVGQWRQLVVTSDGRGGLEPGLS